MNDLLLRTPPPIPTTNPAALFHSGENLTNLGEYPVSDGSKDLPAEQKIFVRAVHYSVSPSRNITLLAFWQSRTAEVSS